LVTAGAAANAQAVGRLCPTALAGRGVKDGVRVNAINPNSIAIDRLQARLQRFAAEQQIDQSEAARRMAQALGVARFGEPAEKRAP
jgi:NAD(P)-dependent dehydrogenase (short-subunit alcohol dehydrogenase family)